MASPSSRANLPLRRAPTLALTARPVPIAGEAPRAADSACEPPPGIAGPDTRTDGAIRIHRLRDEPTLDAFVYTPSRLRPGSHPLVVVHGISRNASEQLRAFAFAAEAEGSLLVAPCFDRERFGDYQRLGRSGRGERADYALDRLLAELASMHPSLDRRVHLFGYSGGAQFVHRYLMAYPERVAAAVSASAGWYTFPDADRKYPYGTRIGRELPGVRFRRERFLAVPTLVIVGSEDRELDESLRQSPSLDRRQGRDRVERAGRWVEAMNALAAERPDAAEDPRFELSILEGAGHDFDQSVAAGLVERTTGFWKRASTRAPGEARGVFEASR